MRIASLSLALACLFAPRGAPAQASGSPYPLIDQPAEVAKGDTVRVLNIVRLMARGSAGSNMQVQYGSRIPLSDTAARRREAALVAKYFSTNAEASGTKQIIAAICDTRACAEMRDAPRREFTYVFERGPNGDWVPASKLSGS